MKPRFSQVAAALAACTVLALLPACGSARPMAEPAPRMVAVTEPDGRTYMAPASSMGIAKVESHAGEWCCADFSCPGDGWGQLVIIGFYVVGYAIYYLGYGVYWCFDAVVEACSDSGSVEDSVQDEEQP